MYQPCGMSKLYLLHGLLPEVRVRLYSSVRLVIDYIHGPCHTALKASTGESAYLHTVHLVSHKGFQFGRLSFESNFGV